MEISVSGSFHRNHILVNGSMRVSPADYLVVPGFDEIPAFLNRNDLVQNRGFHPIELAAFWLHSAEARPSALNLLAAARTHPALTESARQRANSLLARFPAPPASGDWETLASAIAQD